jgi:prepilin-type N-terminal cleavage/methylation domain-containing protein
MVELKNKNGFTLLEVLVSFTLLSIVILVFFSMFQRYAFISNNNEDNIVAMNLAEKIAAKIQHNSDAIEDRYFFIPNNSLNLNHNITDNFLNIDVNRQIDKDNTHYYEATVNNQPFLFTIENITRRESDSYLEDHSTINVKVYDINYTILAENFAYIPNKEWVDSDTVNKLLNEVVKEMQKESNAKLVSNSFYQGGGLFFNLKEEVHWNKREGFTLLQNCRENCDSNGNQPIYYAYGNGNEELFFTIQNVTSYGNKKCDIKVKIYDPFDLDGALQEETVEMSW